MNRRSLSTMIGTLVTLTAAAASAQPLAPKASERCPALVGSATADGEQTRAHGIVDVEHGPHSVDIIHRVPHLAAACAGGGHGGP